MINNYPLCWPIGWKRTAPSNQERGRFSRREQRTSEWGTYDRKKLSVADGRNRVMEALRLFGVDYRDVIISSNVMVRLDGLPRSGQPAPKDPGVAVYWKQQRDTRHKVIAIDRYLNVEDNLAAIAATLEAMRAIERHGGAKILERAFTGFTALPEPNNWRHVMGIDGTPSLEEVMDRYRQLAKKRHPDCGGSNESMAELSRAFDDAKRELEG